MQLNYLYFQAFSYYYFTSSRRLTVYPDVEYLFNFRIIFALAIIGIIAVLIELPKIQMVHPK